VAGPSFSISSLKRLQASLKEVVLTPNIFGASSQSPPPTRRPSNGYFEKDVEVS
jgi:hypothetical protein